jgi:pimeloyl-ACP methyl ester carboxylesterase
MTCGSTIAALACAALLLPPATPAPSREGLSATGLHYRLEGRGPTTVLVHAFHMDLREWNDVVPLLTESRTVLRYDVRGHGTSTLRETLPPSVDDLLGLLDELRIERATLVGSSMGAAIALDLALTAPSRVDRLVLVAPGVAGLPQGPRPAWLTPIMDAARARESTRAAELWWNSALFDRIRSRTDTAARYRRVVLDNARIWTLTPPRPLDPPAGRRLKDVAPTVTAIAGERDELGSLDVARAIAEQVPKGRLVVVAGAGHMLTVERPAELARLILDGER